MMLAERIAKAITMLFFMCITPLKFLVAAAAASNLRDTEKGGAQWKPALPADGILNACFPRRFRRVPLQRQLHKI
jgi:hypothetical protein